jgi:hypothetical protein
MLGPTKIIGHEALSQQVGVYGSYARVIPVIPTFITWTNHKTILQLV